MAPVVVQQRSAISASGKFARRNRRTAGRHVDRPIIVFRGEQAIDFQQFLPRRRVLRLGPLAAACSTVMSVRSSRLTLRATQVRTYSCLTLSPSSSSTAAGRQSSR